MPSISENQRTWGGTYDWSHGGDEWSAPWGGPAAQWRWVLEPRLAGYLPAKHILEIGPGYGKWSSILKDHCDRLTLVDLSQQCIDACQQRFSGASNLSAFANDGRSLPMAADRSVDLVFSFDSLVHAEMDAVDDYVGEFARILTDGGHAFIHHSNRAAYEPLFARIRRFTEQRVLWRAKLVPGVSRWLPPDQHWRARTVSAAAVREAAERHHLRVVGQELISWPGTPYLLDAITILARQHDRPPVVFKNRSFGADAIRISELALIHQP